MIFQCCLGASALYLLSRVTGRDAEILKSAIRVQQLKDLGELLQTDGEVSPLIIAVTGSVASETPIKCDHSDILAVFVEETAEQHFLKRNWKFSWVQVSTLMEPITKQVPWYLDDGTGRVNVAGAQGAIGFTLTAGNEVFEKSETSSLVRRTLDYLKGLKMLGVRRMEHVLPIGTQLTVVGEAVKDSIGDARIQEPEGGPFYVSSIPLDQLISKLGKWSRWFKYASMGLTFVGVVLISKRVTEFFLVRIRYSLERRRQRQQQQMEYEQRRQQQNQQFQRQQQQQIQQYQQQQIEQYQRQQRERREQQQQQREHQQQRQLELQLHQRQQREQQQHQQREHQQQQQQQREQQLRQRQQREQQQHQQREQQLLLMRRAHDEAAATQKMEPVDRESERQHENNSDDTSRSDICVICWDQKYDTAFINCGHMCCCKTCAFKLLNKKCPICRTPIYQVLKVYPS